MDRRVRESRQAKRRVLGARVRRASVHAAELQRHARCGLQLAHEMGHSMHTLLSNAHQPFVYSPTQSSWPKCRPRSARRCSSSTCSRARATIARRSSCCSTRSTASCRLLHAGDVADYECRRTGWSRAIAGHADARRHYFTLLRTYHATRGLRRSVARTWRASRTFSARRTTSISTHLLRVERAADEAAEDGSDGDRARAIERYLTLLKSGGSDHPMTLLQRQASISASRSPVGASSIQLDDLVTNSRRNQPAVLTRWVANKNSEFGIRIRDRIPNSAFQILILQRALIHRGPDLRADDRDSRTPH